MQDFSSEQISTIASSYDAVALALNQYQVEHWSALTHEQQLDLNAYQNSLLNRIEDILTQRVRPAFEDANDMAATIRQASDDAKAGLQRMTDPVIALNTGAMIVAMASYVARPNLPGIKTALRELDNLMKMATV